MNHISLKKFSYYTATLIGLLSLIALPAHAVSTKASGSATTATAQAAANQARLQLIISRGNLEIERRLATLNTLDSKISSATKLSASDAATLTSTVNSDTAQLTTLKAQLDNATTVNSAVTDAQSIITDYRVYALVVPQVDLVKAADDQQTAETKLSAFATKLSARITAAQQAGATNVAAMQATLSDLTSHVNAGQSISNNIETTVIALTPADYNTNHSVLSGDRNQLLTAQSDILDAITDGKTIIGELPTS